MRERGGREREREREGERGREREREGERKRERERELGLQELFVCGEEKRKEREATEVNRRL